MESQTMQEYEIFCRNVTWLRKRYGLSKKQMAKIMGIGIGGVTKLEQGSVPPRMRVDVIISIYRYFGIHPSVQFTNDLGAI